MHAYYAYIAGMKHMHKTQYTLRGVPERVDASVRKKAQKEGTSLNAAALDALRKGLDLTAAPHAYDDMDDLIGTWADDPVFDMVMEEMDQIDPGLWQ